MPALAQPHYLVPDSAAHVAWVRSLLWDRDIEFANEYARLGMIEREGAIAFGATTARGHAGNPFGMGSALVWVLPAALAGAFAHLAAAMGAAVATDGFGTLLLFAVHCGTWAAAIAAALATKAALARLLPAASPAARLLGVAAAFLGTALPYYVLQLPSYAHAPAAFAAALALWVAARSRGRPLGARRAGLLGALAGFVALVRPQDAVLAWVPLMVAGWRPRSPGAARSAVAFGLWFAAVAGLQTLAWSHLYGPGLTPPQGAGFLSLRPEGLWGVLGSTRHGWFAWSPVVLAAVAGWALLARRPATRDLGLAALGAAALAWLVNGSALDWWAGWSFGARRFTTLVPLVALGLAALADRGRRVRWGIGVAAGLGLVQWLRVASRNLTADGDPGLAALWGTGFFEFLPRIPGALWTVLSARWTDLQVLRRPGAPGPDLHPDPAWALAAFFGLWCAALGWGWMAMRARLRARG